MKKVHRLIMASGVYRLLCRDFIGTRIFTTDKEHITCARCLRKLKKLTLNKEKK